MYTLKEIEILKNYVKREQNILNQHFEYLIYRKRLILNDLEKETLKIDSINTTYKYKLLNELSNILETLILKRYNKYNYQNLIDLDAQEKLFNKIYNLYNCYDLDQKIDFEEIQ